MYNKAGRDRGVVLYPVGIGRVAGRARFTPKVIKSFENTYPKIIINRVGCRKPTDRQTDGDGMPGFYHDPPRPGFNARPIFHG